MAEIKFYAGEDFDLTEIASGSGLGFYKDTFGGSIPVSEWNTRTYITNANGNIEGPEVDNVIWAHAQSGILGQSGTAIQLTKIPNYKATLNVRFTHTSAVKTSNAELRIFDRSNINNGPSGVTCMVAEIIHPDTVQNNNGSGDSTWIDAAGSGTTVDLVASPGTSGLSPSGVDTTDTRHDWYLAISASPDSVGSKTQFGAYVSLEYL